MTFWYWETFEMLRKFILCGVVVFIAAGSLLQLCFSITAGVFFLCIHFKYQPYEEDMDDNLQTAALIANFLTLVTTILVREHKLIQKYDPKAEIDSTANNAFLLSVNMLVLATALYALAVDTIPSVVDDYQQKLAMVLNVKATLQSAASEYTNATELQRHATTCTFSDKEQSELSEGQNTVKDKQTALDEKQVGELFKRYDLDGSGTINSYDELKMLCLNLCYRLELTAVENIDAAINDLQEQQLQLEWDVNDFSAWFNSIFMASYVAENI